MKKFFAFIFGLAISSLMVSGQTNSNDHIVLGYGDGEADDVLVWVNTGGMSALKFLSSTGYPIRLVGGSVWISPDWPPGQVTGSSFRIEVLDDDGVENFPGTLLGSMDYTVDSTGWHDFMGFDIIIEEGRFYISMVQTDSPPDCAGLGIDFYPYPFQDMSYIKPPDSAEWELSPMENFMIRAYIQYPVSTGENEAETVKVYAFPNPFTTSTTLSYNPDKPSIVSLNIFNPQGQLIEKIQQKQSKGEQHMLWNAEGLPAGVYYFRIQVGDKMGSGKLMKN